ncbi:MAG TPA: ABC transporter ATP-binding protein [Pilimelia sp.]|nr:ABC transporter ATP-binding protein [Pilimelia sp.]
MSADLRPAHSGAMGGGRGAAVAVTALAKRFVAGGSQITAVDGLTISFEPGSMVAVTGASGSGKSTLLHLVGAIERADSGSIDVDGVQVTELRGKALAAYRRTVGFVFQRFHLLPALTALDNVVAAVLPYKTDFDKRARAREMLAAVGLAGRESSLPGQLSGGQQQRVAIARALMGRPRLLLADEPTGALDSRTGAEVLELLLRLNADHGLTMLIATHERHVADRCQRMIRVADGRLVEDVVRRADAAHSAPIAQA